MDAQDTKHTPSPGSREAIHLGCLCPVFDNAHGKGYMGQPGIYVYTMGCPVHPWAETDDVDSADPAKVSAP